MDRSTRDKVIHKMTTERDLRNQIAYAREEAIRDGRAEGMAEGMAETIRKMLARGISVGANILVNICKTLNRLKSECVIIRDSAAVAVAVQPGVFLVADQ